MNNFDTTTLENAFKTILKNGGVSKTIYNNRPKSATNATDFVVVRLGDSIVDMDAYGECSVDVDLFARDADNLKNGVKLSYMYKKLIECLKPSHDVIVDGVVVASYLFDTNVTIYGDVPDDYGFHARMINVKVIIKVV